MLFKGIRVRYVSGDERKSLHASTMPPLPIIEILVAFPEIDFKKYFQASRHKMERAIQMVFFQIKIYKWDSDGGDHTIFF